MKKISIFLSIMLFSVQFLSAQIENITKKSEENAGKNNQNKSEEPQFNSSGGGDACGELCFACAGDIAVDMLWTHQEYLMENSKNFPQLFGFDFDAIGSMMPSNEIYGFSPNYSANIGIIGATGSYYRYFQPKESGFSVFTATDIFGVLNIGLFKGNSLQSGYGALIDVHSGTSFAAFTIGYTSAFSEFRNVLEFNYRQAVTSADDGSIPYINAHVLFKKVIGNGDVLKIKGVAGMKFQQFYGENLIFLTAGINVELL